MESYDLTEKEFHSIGYFSAYVFNIVKGQIAHR